MARTFVALDPRSGRLRWFCEYERGGTVVVQRLPDHLFRDALTPARMEAMADFAEAASTAFGRRASGDLPPAAEAVRKAKLKRLRENEEGFRWPVG